MAKIAIGCGLALVALGLAGYFGTDRVSVTALIPAFFGAPLLLLGLLALKDAWRKHAMHAAAALGLLGFVGAAAMVAPKLPTILSGGELQRPVALQMQALMAVICFIFEVLCIRSFIAARRSRAAPEQP